MKTKTPTEKPETDSIRNPPLGVEQKVYIPSFLLEFYGKKECFCLL